MLLRNADPASLVDKSLAHSAAACTPRTLSLTISNGRCHGTTIAVKIAARCHAPQTETALASEFFHLKNLHAGMRRGDRPRPPRSASLTLGIGAVAFSRTGDPMIGEFGDAQLLRKFGNVPDDLSGL